jgi:hypothetical protein
MANDFHVIVLQGVRTKTAAGWLTQAKAVDSATTANAQPFAPIATQQQQLHTDTATLDGAESKAKSKAIDDIAARNLALRNLKKSYRAFVLALQNLSNAQPGLAEAQQIAAQAGLKTKVVVHALKKDFDFKCLGNGVVRLVVKVPVKKSVRIFYDWAMSADGTNWTSLQSTNDPTTTVSNLTPGNKVYFRYRYTTKNTPSAWSQRLEVLVT